jgi:hypothetical protein
LRIYFESEFSNVSKSAFKIFNTHILPKCIYFFIYRLEHEIDGETLEMMNSVDKITTLIPKFKQQLVFLKEREKLFKANDDSPIQRVDAPSISSTSSNSSFLSPESINTHSTIASMNNLPLNQPLVDRDTNVAFPDEYTIPPIPNSLLKDIEEGALDTFGPHFSNRQVLIDVITHDLIQKYKLL